MVSRGISVRRPEQIAAILRPPIYLDLLHHTDHLIQSGDEELLQNVASGFYGGESFMLGSSPSTAQASSTISFSGTSTTKNGRSLVRRTTTRRWKRRGRQRFWGGSGECMSPTSHEIRCPEVLSVIRYLDCRTPAASERGEESGYEAMVDDAYERGGRGSSL
ncbi:hypothetical protein KSP40_PGU010084 [Platanthera guangdongensis]|uniref:Uncharacterized protein n=1 Tax=Platanthera guangdongensis TaxID=2320717 RepID=A0ABR2LL06_9ASPA